MNDFKESVKFTDEGETAKKVKREEIKKKLKDTVLKAILEMQVEGNEEKMIKMEYAMALRNIIEDYEELRPLLNRFADEKRLRGKIELSKGEK